MQWFQTNMLKYIEALCKWFSHFPNSYQFSAHLLLTRFLKSRSSLLLDFWQLSWGFGAHASVHESFISTVAEIMSQVRYLQGWIAVVGLMALGNTVQCFVNHRFLAEHLYTGAAGQGRQVYTNCNSLQQSFMQLHSINAGHELWIRSPDTNTWSSNLLPDNWGNKSLINSHTCFTETT